MSKYDSFQTTLTEEEPLIAALKGLGYPVEIHAPGSCLYGYHGDERPERAQIIIRREHLNCASNDIGFARQQDGRFAAIVSEYDQSIGFDQVCAFVNLIWPHFDHYIWPHPKADKFLSLYMVSEGRAGA